MKPYFSLRFFVVASAHAIQPIEFAVKFSVGKCSFNGNQATVTVVFADGENAELSLKITGAANTY